MLSLDKVQKELVEQDFVEKYSDWSSNVYDELDWAKVKELQVRELLVERQKMATIAQNAESLSCPNFVKHVSNPHKMGHLVADVK